MKRALTLILVIAICILLPLRVEAWEDRSVVHVKTEEKVIALTFDDGPHPRYTERILAVLAKHDVKATFFMVGINVERYPAAAKAVVDAGHEIGNHTYHHAHLAGMNEGDTRDEVDACARRILDICGASPLLFRAPEGTRGETLHTLLDSMGYRQILWNVDTLDWKGRESGDIAKTVLRKVRGGDIILMHDYVSGKLQSEAALGLIIPALKARGYRFVTVSELLTYGEVVYPHF